MHIRQGLADIFDLQDCLSAVRACLYTSRFILGEIAAVMVRPQLVHIIQRTMGRPAGMSLRPCLHSVKQYNSSFAMSEMLSFSAATFSNSSYFSEAPLIPFPLILKSSWGVYKSSWGVYRELARITFLTDTIGYIYYV